MFSVQTPVPRWWVGGKRGLRGWGLGTSSLRQHPPRAQCLPWLSGAVQQLCSIAGRWHQGVAQMAKCLLFISLLWVDQVYGGRRKCRGPGETATFQPWASGMGREKRSALSGCEGKRACSFPGGFWQSWWEVDN